MRSTRTCLCTLCLAMPAEMLGYSAVQGDEIIALLEARKQYHDLFIYPRGSGSVAKLGGFERTAEQCQRKFKKLTEKFNKTYRKIQASGEDSVAWKTTWTRDIFRHMSDICRDTPGYLLAELERKAAMVAATAAVAAAGAPAVLEPSPLWAGMATTRKRGSDMLGGAGAGMSTGAVTAAPPAAPATATAAGAGAAAASADGVPTTHARKIARVEDSNEPPAWVSSLPPDLHRELLARLQTPPRPRPVSPTRQDLLTLCSDMVQGCVSVDEFAQRAVAALVCPEAVDFAAVRLAALGLTRLGVLPAVRSDDGPESDVLAGTVRRLARGWDCSDAVGVRALVDAYLLEARPDDIGVVCDRVLGPVPLGDALPRRAEMDLAHRLADRELRVRGTLHYACIQSELGILPTPSLRASVGPICAVVYAAAVNEAATGLVPLLAQLCAVRRLYGRPVNGVATDGRTWLFVRLLETGYWLSSDISRPTEVLAVLRRWIRGDVPPEWTVASA